MYPTKNIYDILTPLLKYGLAKRPSFDQGGDGCVSRLRLPMFTNLYQLLFIRIYN